MTVKLVPQTTTSTIGRSSTPQHQQTTQTLLRRRVHVSIMAIAMVALNACGGGSGDSQLETSQDSLIIGGSNDGDASSVSDDQLRQTAATLAGAGLAVNLNSLSRLNDEAIANQDSGSVVGGITNSTDTEMIDSLDFGNSNFLRNTLGIDDPGARTTRVGNIITIDPDDQSICRDDIPLAGGLNDDQSLCQQLVVDLTVQIDAKSEETGIITYLFQNVPVLLIGYSPMGASYEIDLTGLALLIRRANELNGIVESTMAMMSGVVRLSGTILNDEPGQEAGNLSLDVTETISLGISGSEEGLTLQPSNVFGVTYNEATGDVSMGVDWGALQLITSNESYSSNGEFSSSTSAIRLGGLSASLSFNENQPALKITNIGIGNVPLTVTIDSIESVNLTLAKFGISVDNETGTITLDGALNTNFMLNNIAQLLEDQAPEFTASATISAPANSVLVPQENGSALLSSGGPITATIIGGDGVSSGQTELSVDAGECFGAGDDTTNLNAAAIIGIVPCD